MTITIREIDVVLKRVYAWSKTQEFKGYNKHDALNSPLLRTASGWGKWPRIFAIQSVMRFPVNVRPILGVPRTLNPKGLALFVMGLLDWYKSDGDMDHLKDAERLLSMLLAYRSRGPWSGDCWGYPYPWQDLGFFAPAFTPNAVVTCFVCEAFLSAYEMTRKRSYLDTVASACNFLYHDLTALEDSGDGLCLSYMPLPMKMKVLDVSILIAAVLGRHADLSGHSGNIQVAERLAGFVVEKQTDYGAWFYTDPPEDSPIGHDNYHTGFILDALWRYMEATRDGRWKNNYKKGLAFYAERLFNPDGSPRWMSDKNYPHDIHGAAQGLVSFSLALQGGYDYRGLLESIGAWAIGEMYQLQGRFYYQQGRYFKKRFTLLRWCNAWMFRGLSAWRRYLS